MGGSVVIREHFPFTRRYPSAHAEQSSPAYPVSP